MGSANPNDRRVKLVLSSGVEVPLEHHSKAGQSIVWKAVIPLGEYVTPVAVNGAGAKRSVRIEILRSGKESKTTLRPGEDSSNRIFMIHRLSQIG